MARRWRFVPHDAGRIEALERATRVSPLVAQILLARGVTSGELLQAFLEPKLSDLRDPELLPGVPQAVEVIHRAVRAGRRMVVYGDYDADGITATAILVLTLRMLGADVGYYVPNRLEEGYGLNADALRLLAERGTSLVITVDCGIASLSEAAVARELGIELVVTDHHQMAESLPDAAALVHPALPGADYPFHGLCGAGVAFKLAWALCCKASDARKVSDAMRELLLTAVGLAAIGTVADVVPLLDENRILVRHGLTSLTHRPPLGVAKLAEVCKIAGRTLSAEDLAFMLGPRLNAAGRLGQALLAVELLTTADPQRATDLARYIHELNNTREKLERSVYVGAVKQINERFDAAHDPAFVLASPGWHCGVIGIVAGRLAEKYQRPVVLISMDEVGAKPAVGSGRSGGAVDLHQAFAVCAEHLTGFGGHRAAAGLRIQDARIDHFRDAFCEHIGVETGGSAAETELRIDGEAIFAQLTLAAVLQLEQLAPFGQANPRPVLCASAVQLVEPPKKLGGGDRHLAVKLRQHQVTLRGVAFGGGEWFEPLSELAGPIDVAFRPTINEFAGRRSVEVQLVDWRPCQVPELAARG